MSYANPAYLVSAEELHAHLTDDSWRVFDTSVFLTPQGHGYQIDSGRERYREAHIPGAGFIDLADDWADTSNELRFTLPQRDTLNAAIGASGISADHKVVLYSSGHLMWATRAWWLLHHAGHKDIAILNGNLSAWQAAGFPLNQGDEGYPAEVFSPSTAIDRFATTSQVEAGMHGATCTLNALSRSLYEGTGDFYYQRRGHIPGSRLLYYDTLLDNEFFRPAGELREALQQVGAMDADHVITYCGGGIAATLDAFACALVGQENVAVYDGSMSEWVQNPDRPLTVGSAP